MCLSVVHYFLFNCSMLNVNRELSLPYKAKSLSVRYALLFTSSRMTFSDTTSSLHLTLDMNDMNDSNMIIHNVKKYQGI